MKPANINIFLHSKEEPVRARLLNEMYAGILVELDGGSHIFFPFSSIAMYEVLK